MLRLFDYIDYIFGTFLLFIYKISEDDSESKLEKMTGTRRPMYMNNDSDDEPYN